TDGKHKKHIVFPEIAGLEPFHEHTRPAVIIGAGSEFRNVIRRSVGFDSDNLAEIIYGMGCVGRPAADSQYEEPPPTFPRVLDQFRHFFHGRAIDPIDDLSSFLQIFLCETHSISFSELALDASNKKAQLFESGGRTNLIEALRSFECSKLPIVRQSAVQDGHVRGFPLRDRIKRGRPEYPEAIIDVVHSGCQVLL